LLPDAPGLQRRVDQQASESLLNDLRSDKGMEWVPRSMWLTYLGVSETAGKLRYDLAVDASGRGRPWHLDAGLPKPKPDPFVPITTPPLPTTTLSTLASTAPLHALPARHEEPGRPLWPALVASFAIAAAIGGVATWRRRERAA
jgi:hypothetical protein